MTAREKAMLAEENKRRPNYDRFRKNSGGVRRTAATLGGRARQIDSIVDEAARGGAERQSEYKRN